MGQWIDDNKSVSVREDLAYNLICYINTLVIKTDEFKKKKMVLQIINQLEEKQS